MGKNTVILVFSLLMFSLLFFSNHVYAVALPFYEDFEHLDNGYNLPGWTTSKANVWFTHDPYYTKTIQASFEWFDQNTFSVQSPKMNPLDDNAMQKITCLIHLNPLRLLSGQLI